MSEVRVIVSHTCREEARRKRMELEEKRLEQLRNRPRVIVRPVTEKGK